MIRSKFLKKLGYKKEDLEEMEIKDIIELGKLGYTKEEIETLKKNEGPAVSPDLEKRLDQMQEKIDGIVSQTQERATRETVTTKENMIDSDNSVNEILEKLAFGLKEEEYAGKENE